MPKSAEQKKEMTFEQIEKMLFQLDEKSKSYRKRFEEIRDQAERIQRDIASSQKAGDQCLNKYRSLLYDGEKQAAEQFLEKVSKHRKQAEKLNESFPDLRNEADQLAQAIERTRIQLIELSETGILLGLKQRLENSLNKTGGLLHDFSHTTGEITKLSDSLRSK